MTDTRKLAKLLKDMMDRLIASTPYLGSWRRELELLGMLQFGMHVDIVSLDQVGGRYCRLNWEQHFTVPSTLEDDGIHDILLLVKELLVFEMRIANVLDVLKACSHPKELDFLNRLFDREATVSVSPPPTPNPRTMTTPPPSPKRRSD